MTVATSFPDADAADPSLDRADWHEPMLKELAEIGMALARALLRRELAKAAHDDGAGPDPQVAFERVARAVRRTVALNAHLRQQKQAGPAKAAAKPVEKESAVSPHMNQAMADKVRARYLAQCRKCEVAGRLSEQIETEVARGERRERLLDDLDLKLDVAVNTADFAERPIEDVVAEIRHGLGLGPKPVASNAAANDDEGPDDEDWDDDDRGDEPGEAAERLEPGWGTAPSPPRRGSG